MTHHNQDDLFCYKEHLQNNHPETRIDIVAQTDSTQRQVKPNSVFIADSQQAGVGRRGNQWFSPAGRSISLSYRFCLPLTATELSGFQLTTALAVTAVMKHFGSPPQRLLKWPNDLCFEQRKFGGILINLSPNQDRQSTDVTVGIGLNWSLSEKTLTQIDQPVCNIPIANKPHRGLFIDQLLSRLKQVNQQFCDDGLKPFLKRWSHQDSLQNSRIELKQDRQIMQGDYAGLSPRGELQIRVNGQIRCFGSGEVRVRAL
ncbi:bifunctional ligase/repressor BirA [Marinicella pacifica]|uniref:Bifunctional ligase/repressor BirA n=1 Tax=Marinicella pacifica TaxID=1171543 RepID=A0A917CI48_9GAMM|nr:biotin--[acetyl-CoA-carboxylase] ligase [Marinicella pacifica]GGF87523.1 bifunctional ligase/repressor BirA [Marinicella pacifica]